MSKWDELGLMETVNPIEKTTVESYRDQLADAQRRLLEQHSQIGSLKDEIATLRGTIVQQAREIVLLDADRSWAESRLRELEGMDEVAG